MAHVRFKTKWELEAALALGEVVRTKYGYERPEDVEAREAEKSKPVEKEPLEPFDTDSIIYWKLPQGARVQSDLYGGRSRAVLESKAIPWMRTKSKCYLQQGQIVHKDDHGVVFNVRGRIFRLTWRQVKFFGVEE